MSESISRLWASAADLFGSRGRGSIHRARPHVAADRTIKLHRRTARAAMSISRYDSRFAAESQKTFPSSPSNVVPEPSARHGRSTAFEAVICSCRLRLRLRPRPPRADHVAAFATPSSTRLRPQHALPQTRSSRSCCVRACVTTSPSPLPRRRMPSATTTTTTTTTTRRNCASSQPRPTAPPPRTRSASLRLVRATASQASS